MDRISLVAEREKPPPEAAGEGLVVLGGYPVEGGGDRDWARPKEVEVQPPPQRRGVSTVYDRGRQPPRGYRSGRNGPLQLHIEGSFPPLGLWLCSPAGLAVAMLTDSYRYSGSAVGFGWILQPGAILGQAASTRRRRLSICAGCAARRTTSSYPDAQAVAGAARTAPVCSRWRMRSRHRSRRSN